MHLPKFLVQNLNINFFSLLYSPSPFDSAVLVSATHSSETGHVFLGVHVLHRRSVYLEQPQCIITLPFFAPSHPAMLDSSHSHPSHCSYELFPCLRNGCSKPWPYWLQFILYLYPTSSCLPGTHHLGTTQLLRSYLKPATLWLESLLFPVPHQRFLPE